MDKKKVIIASKAQLKQALLLRALTKTAGSSQPLVTGKGSVTPSPAVMPMPPTKYRQKNPPLLLAHRQALDSSFSASGIVLVSFLLSCYLYFC